MIFIETKIFTKQILSLLDDDEYKKLQTHLLSAPDSGKFIKGSGGLRKIRWKLTSKGKQGGVRVIYYWFTAMDKIIMLLAYPKSERDDLTIKQQQLLRNIVEEELNYEKRII